MIPTRSELLATIIVPLFILAAIIPDEAQARQKAITLAGCEDKCGDIEIPYPFGMAAGCFVHGFKVTCNTTFDPPRAFLVGGDTKGDEYPTQLNADGYYLSYETGVQLNNVWAQPVELIDISLERGEARAYTAITTDCSTNDTYHLFTRQLTSMTSPFLVSASRNVLTGIGWDIDAQLTSSLKSSGYKLACVSRLIDPSAAESGPCSSGMGCCEANVPAGTPVFSVTFVHKNNSLWSPNPCSYGMVVERHWYNFSSKDLYGYEVFSGKYPRGVPFVIDFAIRNNSSCPAQGLSPSENYACLSGNSSCVNATSGSGYLCKCWEHYDGNAYIPGGCQDIDECEFRKQHPDLKDQYPCSNDGVCINRLGGYDCPCKRGMKGDGKAGTCAETFPTVAKVIVGSIGGLLLLAIMSFVVILYKEKKKMRDFFQNNGGPILEKVKNIVIFKKEDIKRITKNYSHVLGKGYFGVVYKGFVNEVPVAVKLSKEVNSMQKEQFANEVIIQSKIIHKNIVRLLGCCLEVDVPILVYEFVPKGSLEDIIHGKNNGGLTFDILLGIATESAEGLAYMHSKTDTNIQHGDVKPANILLDDNFTPKISDFGISRLLARGKIEHADNVIGDNNYMDPVYRATGLLTNKSDVYSFGIVLYELITKKKAVYGGDSTFIRTYLNTYISEIRESRVKGSDDNIMAEEDIDHLCSIVGITNECLDKDVDQRPEMTDIAERLQNIRRTRKK